MGNIVFLFLFREDKGLESFLPFEDHFLYRGSTVRTFPLSLTHTKKVFSNSQKFGHFTCKLFAIQVKSLLYFYAQQGLLWQVSPDFGAYAN
jgi:hypothetical protein